MQGATIPLNIKYSSGELAGVRTLLRLMLQLSNLPSARHEKNYNPLKSERKAMLTLWRYCSTEMQSSYNPIKSERNVKVLRLKQHHGKHYFESNPEQTRRKSTIPFKV